MPCIVFRRGLQLRIPTDGTVVSIDARSGRSIEVALYKTGQSWAPQNVWQWLRREIIALGEKMNIAPTSEIVIIRYVSERTGEQKEREVSVGDLYDFLREGERYYQAPGKRFNIHDLLCDAYGYDAAEAAVRGVERGDGESEFKDRLMVTVNIENAHIGNMNNIDMLNGSIITHATN